MRPDDEPKYTHAAFMGLRNNVPPSRFGLEDLAVARNVDIDDSGRIMRRRGYTSVAPGAWHSLWSNGTRCFGVSGAALNEILPAYDIATLATVTPDAEMSWLPIGARVYWSNAYETGCIDGSVNRSWGLALPRRLSATPIDGALRGGRYQYTMTYLRSDGQESGAPLSNVIELGENGGMHFAALPVSVDPTVTHKAIYVSEVNGERLWRAAVLANAVTTAVIVNRVSMVLSLATQFLGPPPAGAVLAMHGGRVLVAVGNLLYYGEPFAPELLDRRRSFALPSAITLLAPVDGGVYVGTETQHFFLDGSEASQYQLRERVQSKAIRGTLSYAPDSVFGKSASENLVAIWHTSEGIVRGDASGAIANLTRDRFFFPVQERGASVMRTTRGINQYLAVLQGTETAAPSAHT